MLKLKAYPAKVKERAAPPEVLEKSGVLGQCADVQLQRWAVVKNIEVCDTVIDFQSMRPLYSWDKSSLSQQKTFLHFLAFLSLRLLPWWLIAPRYSTQHFLLCLLVSGGLPVLSSIETKDQVILSSVLPKVSPVPRGTCDATCCGSHGGGTMRLQCLQFWTLEKTP